MGPGFPQSFCLKAMASRRSHRDLQELLKATGLEDGYLAILDDMSSEELWEEVVRHAGPPAVGDTLRFEGPLHQYVQDLGKRRKIALSAGQHRPVEIMSAGGLLAERRQAESAREQRCLKASVVAVPSEPKGGCWPHRVARARADGQSLGDAEAAARERLIGKENFCGSMPQSSRSSGPMRKTTRACRTSPRGEGSQR